MMTVKETMELEMVPARDAIFNEFVGRDIDRGILNPNELVHPYYGFVEVDHDCGEHGIMISYVPPDVWDEMEESRRERGW